MSVPTLVVTALQAGYMPNLPIVRSASLALSAGEILTIVGPNGAGKSTLLKAIAGLVPISTGDVLLRGQSLLRVAAHRMIGLGVAFVPQTANVFATLTIQENLRVAAHSLRHIPPNKIEELYAMFPDLALRRRRSASELSGGQRQMLAIARALIAKPSVVMLDEPTAGLSPKAATQVFSTLRQLANSGIAILLVEQNARSALKMSDRGIVLVDGANRMEDRAANLLDDPQLVQSYLGPSRRAR
jgi:branched-chain amino acid transport system ATP-binding protein